MSVTTEGVGDTVVIVHGAGDTPASWLPVRRLLAEHARVVTFDRSELATRSAGRDVASTSYVASLRIVIDQVSPDAPVVLVGHSLGGLVSRVYRQQHPHRVRGLVLIDSTPDAIVDDRAVRVGFLASALATRVLRMLAPLGVVRWMVRTEQMPLYPEQRRFRELATPTEYDSWCQAVIQAFSLPTPERELRSVVATARAANTALSTAPTTAVPVSVIASHAWGDKWARLQQDLARQIYATTYHGTEDRFHNIHMADPELVATAIRRVLAATDHAQPAANPH